MEDGYITKNVARSKRIVVASAKKAKERKALKQEDVKHIISQLSKLTLQERRAMAIYLCTGARRGEMLAMRWEDIDLCANVVHIRRAVTFTGEKHRPVVGSTKSDAGIRDVPLLPQMIEWIAPMNQSGYIVGEDGLLLESQYNRLWDSIRNKLDLGKTTAHFLRHTYGTMLGEAGLGEFVIQDAMGHADSKTTKRYVKTRTEHMAEEVGKVSAALGHEV